MTGPLNLSDANLAGFEAVDPGRYNCTVYSMEFDATTNPAGNLPVGSPIIKITYQATEDNPDGVPGRRFWQNLYVPPSDYDEKKAQNMKGMIARTFIALGEDEATVVSKKFNIEPDDFIGRECVVQVGKEQKRTREGDPIEGEFNNPVKGVKPAGTAPTGNGGGLL